MRMREDFLGYILIAMIPSFCSFFFANGVYGFVLLGREDRMGDRDNLRIVVLSLFFHFFDFRFNFF